MTARQVARLGNPVLRVMSSPFTRQEILNPSTKVLVKDMLATMKAQNGIGLAAPQISVNKQVVIVEIPAGMASVKPFPRTVIFNPKLEFPTTEKIFMWEGCLSVPGLTGKVSRFKHCHMTYLDETATERKIKAVGYAAGVLQHEIDHLWGKLYVDLVDTKHLYYNEEFLKLGSAAANGVCYEGHAEFL
ncbi:Peptide deformylase [Balamuthia mandrillaris]